MNREHLICGRPYLGIGLAAAATSEELPSGHTKSAGRMASETNPAHTRRKEKSTALRRLLKK